MIERTALGRAARHPGVQENQDVRKRDDVEGAGFDRRPAERVHPEFLVFVDARRVEMMVAVDDRTILGNQDLRGRLGCRIPDEEGDERDGDHSTHRTTLAYRLAFCGASAAQRKLSAASILPVPVYAATCG